MDEAKQNNVQPQPVMPQEAPSKTLWYLLGALAVVLIIAGAVFWKGQGSISQTPSQQSKTATSTLPRSKAPGIVTGLSTAVALDAKGNPITTATTFAVTDKNIYLVVAVNKPVVGTKIEYIRYLNGKYLDNGTLKITKPNLTHVSFVWSLKTITAKRPVGVYSVKVYTNGIFEKETSYSVR